MPGTSSQPVDYSARIAATQRERDRFIQSVREAAEANIRDHAIRGFFDGGASVLSHPLAIASLGVAAALSFWPDFKKETKDSKKDDKKDEKTVVEVTADNNKTNKKFLIPKASALPALSGIAGHALTLPSGSPPTFIIRASL